MFVSTIHQGESGISIHMSPRSWTSLPLKSECYSQRGKEEKMSKRQTVSKQTSSQTNLRAKFRKCGCVLIPHWSPMFCLTYRLHGLFCFLSLSLSHTHSVFPFIFVSQHTYKYTEIYISMQVCLRLSTVYKWLTDVEQEENLETSSVVLNCGSILKSVGGIYKNIYA